MRYICYNQDTNRKDNMNQTEKDRAVTKAQAAIDELIELQQDFIPGSPIEVEIQSLLIRLNLLESTIRYAYQ